MTQIRSRRRSSRRGGSVRAFAFITTPLTEESGGRDEDCQLVVATLSRDLTPSVVCGREDRGSLAYLS
jgi:hypothetical protein